MKNTVTGLRTAELNAGRGSRGSGRSWIAIFIAVAFWVITLEASAQGQEKAVASAAPARVLKALADEGLGAVSEVAFSHDGRKLAASVGMFGRPGRPPRTSTLVWDVATVKLERKLDGQGAALAFSPNGLWLASADSTTVKLWDAQTWKEARTLQHNDRPGSCGAIAFRHDGGLLATGCHDIKFWNPATGQLRGAPIRPDNVDVVALAFSPDARKLAGAGVPLRGSRFMGPQWAKIWEAGSGRELRSMPDTEGAPIAFSPDGRWLATRGREEIELRAVSTGELARGFKYTTNVMAMAFSPDGKTLAAAEESLGGHSGENGLVQIWETETGREVRNMGDPSGARGIAFSPDGRWLAVAVGAEIKIWEISGRP